MYTSFEVENFRCFKKLILPSLARINLIAGVNNVGKTALLEALFLHAGASNPELSLKLNAFRGIEKMKVAVGKWEDYPWFSLFRQFDISKPIELASHKEANAFQSVHLRAITAPAELKALSKKIEYEITPSGMLELQYQDEKGIKGPFYLILDQRGIRFEPAAPSFSLSTFFLSSRKRPTFEEEAELFGDLEKKGKQELISQTLKILEPRLRRLSMIYTPGQPILHGDIGLEEPLPLPFMGEGMVRLANIAIRVGNAAGGIVLLDEIENGLHHTVLREVWKAIAEAARQFNTQVFATTHSRECIAAAHQAFVESGTYDFRLHRLDRINHEIRAVTYDQESLQASLEMNLEVR